MNNRTQALILGAALLLACSTLIWSSGSRIQAEEKLKRVELENKVLKLSIDSLREEYELMQDNFADALDLRESEISYWGRICEKMKEKYPRETGAATLEVRKEMGIE
jgi:DNA-binding transcriptional regulator YiaG